MAPEVLFGKNYNERADIFSIGVITYSLLTGGYPFEATSMSELQEKLLSEEPDLGHYKLKKISKECKDFLKKSLEKDHHKRPSAAELL